MKALPRLESAEPVIHGVLKLVFMDGYEGVIDLRPIIAKGRIFTWLQSPESFAKVKLDPFGHFVWWTNDDGYQIDLGADGLRRDCERQAAIHALMAS